jgi:hypothetical protein
MVESAALLVDDILPEQPVRQWVLSFPFQLRFLFASNPGVMSQVLGIVYRVISGALLKKAGLTRKNGMTGAVTLVQRFGSALNLNVHFHMLFIDGAYSRNQYGKVVFKRTKAPEKDQLCKLVNKISLRVAAYLERQGFLERDEENSYLQLDGMGEDPMQQLLGHSITYRVAVGPQQGKKVFTLQTVPATETSVNAQTARESGFSLHAGVVAQHWERKKLERLSEGGPVVTLLDRLFRRSVCQLHRPAIFATSSRHPTGKACPMSEANDLGMAHRMLYSNRWIFWPGSRRWCRSRG